MLTTHKKVKYKYTVPTMAYISITDFIRLPPRVKTNRNIICEIKMKFLMHGV